VAPGCDGLIDPDVPVAPGCALIDPDVLGCAAVLGCEELIELDELVVCAMAMPPSARAPRTPAIVTTFMRGLLMPVA
jgi:hypothetical protein